MATNKAKRPILLAQPQPQHAKTARAGGPRPQRRRTNSRNQPDRAELMPVKAYVYRAIAEMNGGFEKVAQELQTLRSVSYFHSESVGAMRELICRLRTQANRDFTTAMRDREQTNAGYYETHKKKLAC